MTRRPRPIPAYKARLAQRNERLEAQELSRFLVDLFKQLGFEVDEGEPAPVVRRGHPTKEARNA